MTTSLNLVAEQNCLHAISLIDVRESDSRFAPKVTRLCRLFKAGLPVPATIAIAVEIEPWLQNPACYHKAFVQQLQRNLPDQSTLPFVPGKYCLRSASPAEDNTDQSGAGALDSLFGIRPAQLLSHDMPTRMGSFVDAQIALTRTRLPEAKWISFLYQQQIPVSQSGVLFTRHPSPLIPNIMLSETWRGHGLRLTSGQIRPRQLWFAAEDGRPLVRDGQRYRRPFARWMWDLGRLSIACKNLFPEYSAGLDLEWCRLGGTVILLQVRPITGKIPLDTYLWNGALGDEFWSGEVSRYMFATVGRAIETSMIRRPLATMPRSHEWKMPVLKRHASRVYFNVGVLASLYHQLPGWGQIPALHRMIESEGGDHTPFSPFPLVTRRFLRLLWHLLLARPRWLPWQPLRDMAVYQRAADRMLTRQRNDNSGSSVDILVQLEAYLDMTVWGMVWAYVFVQIAEKILNRIVGDEKIRSLPWQGNLHDPVYRMHRDLWQGHLVYKTDPDRAVDSIVHRYGHATSARDLSAARWFEQPDTVRRILTRVQAPPADPRTSWQAVTMTATALYRKKRCLRALTILGAWPLAYVARRLTGWREQMRTVSDRYLCALRLTALASIKPHRVTGNEGKPATTPTNRLWNTDPWTGTSDPVQDEAGAAAWLRGDQPTAQQRVASHKNSLSGTPVFGGTIEGIACSLEQLLQGKLPDNPILVSDYLDPSVGPLLPELAGAVFESGGALSHGGILAREYGLPCIAGVVGARRKLLPKHHILLDALHGTVKVLHD